MKIINFPLRHLRLSDHFLSNLPLVIDLQIVPPKGSYKPPDKS